MSSNFLFPTPRNTDLFDDFVGVGIDSTAKRVASSLSWGYSGDGSVTIGTAAAGATGNVGNVHLLSGDVDTNATSLFLGNSANGPVLHSDDVQAFEYRVRMSSIDHLQAIVGLGSNIPGAGLGASSLGWYMTETGALISFSRASSSETTRNTGVTLDASHWYRLIGTRRSATEFSMRCIDGNTGDLLAVTEHATNVPSSTLTAGVALTAIGAGVGLHLKIDTFALRLKRDIRL